jgi:hypothetical protein
MLENDFQIFGKTFHLDTRFFISSVMPRARPMKKAGRVARLLRL